MLKAAQQEKNHSSHFLEQSQWGGAQPPTKVGG